ncbi:MAG: hypothetical protein ACFB20_11240 [Opitutales bacterium]
MPIHIRRCLDCSFLLESFHGAIDLALLQSLMRWLAQEPSLDQCQYTLLDLREAELVLRAETVRILAREHARVLETRGRRRIALLVDCPLSTAFAMMWKQQLPNHVSVPEVFCSLDGALSYLGARQDDFEAVARSAPLQTLDECTGEAASHPPVQAAG